MNRRMLARITSTSLMLGIATVGCTAPDRNVHPAALADRAPKATEIAARAADKARTAMTARKGVIAVAAAEEAVTAQPRNPAYRLLLGQSYLTVGRFTSAQVSFRDALTLSPELAKARFDLALTQIALGRGQEAQASLHGLEGIAPADLGLALVMAGDREGGTRMLIDLVRSGKSDARGRQNLALAFAIDGRWAESRAVAMQDTPGDRIEAQLAHWAVLAGPQAGGPQQVAAMLGVNPASDPGLPTALALAQPVAPSVGAAPVALAAAAPPAPATVVQTIVSQPVAAPVTLAMTAPAPAHMAVAEVKPVVVPFDAAPPAIPFVNAPAAAVVLAAAQQAPVTLAPMAPPLLRRSVAQLPAPPAARPAPTLVKSAPIIVPHRGGYVVQLGAYARGDAIQNAWSQASRLMPRLSGYNPAKAEFSFAGGALVRLSVSGFESRSDAVKLCTQIKARGGHCFVRAAAGDAPLQWVNRASKVQVATL